MLLYVCYYTMEELIISTSSVVLFLFLIFRQLEIVSFGYDLDLDRILRIAILGLTNCVCISNL